MVCGIEQNSKIFICFQYRGWGSWTSHENCVKIIIWHQITHTSKNSDFDSLAQIKLNNLSTKDGEAAIDMDTVKNITRQQRTLTLILWH